MKKLTVLVMAMLLTGYAHAANKNDIYFGGGLGLNSLSGIDFSDGLGFQIFAGYDLPVKMGKGKLSVEAGYMDTGKMEFGTIPTFSGPIVVEDKATGLWGNAVFSLPLQDKLNLVVRAGLDIGDDDGIMFGGGLGFKLNSKMEVRGEYVIRDHVDSLQVNLVMRM